MRDLLQNFSLKNHNTFKIETYAKYFFEFDTVDQLIELLKDKSIDTSKKLILGGGSNLVFCKDFDGVVLHSSLKGKTIIHQTDNEIFIRVGSGENWDDFVAYTVNKGWGGIENLTAIPGSVGAVPVQNIGAYGVEAKDVIEYVEIVDLDTLEIKRLNNKDCNFKYRNSLFKNELNHKCIITYVTFRLSLRPTFNIKYGNIANELKKYDTIDLSIIRKVVKKIRDSKLPDPTILPNAGSFFKNPIVATERAILLQKKFPNIPIYKVSEERVKLAAAWLIEQCGWRGKRIGNVGSHKDQALVIINYGNATGREIKDFSEHVQQSVLEKFNIKLEREVNLV